MKLKVKLSPFFAKHHAMKTFWGNGSIAPCIINLGTGWKWVVSFKRRPLYPCRISPRYLLDPGLKIILREDNIKIGLKEI
jgi:hypothetical protein